MKKPFRVMTTGFVNSKGIVFYLHRGTGNFFFNRDPKETVDTPKGYFAEENPKTGIPVLRKLLVREI